MDNLATLMAGCFFVLWAALWEQTDQRECNRSGRLTICVLPWLLALTRVEYVLLLPLYVLLRSVSRRIAGLSRHHGILWFGVVGSLLLGLLTNIVFRGLTTGDYAVAPGQYSCWTFLDGTPPSWLRPGDDTEWKRVQTGMQFFGDPADYDYSLFRIVRAHPGMTVKKFLGNIPAWCFELGRRHVVVPLPLSLLACLGAVVLLGQSIACRRKLATTGVMLSLILMTLPIACLMVYSEYLMPALAGICLLAGYGADWSVRRVVRLGTGFRQSTYRYLGLASLVLLMCGLNEFLLVRGGGLLPGTINRTCLADFVDVLPRQPQRRDVIALDPYSAEVDICSRVEIRNVSPRAEGFGNKSVEPPNEIDSASADHPSPAALRSWQEKVQGIDTAVVWQDGGEPDAEFRTRLSRWLTAGFSREQDIVLKNSAGHQFVVQVLRREPQPENSPR